MVRNFPMDIFFWGGGGGGQKIFRVLDVEEWPFKGYGLSSRTYLFIFRLLISGHPHCRQFSALIVGVLPVF